MADFASSAMVRILMAGMRQLGLEVPPLPVRGGTIALDAKRQLLQAAVAQRGVGVLPHLGKGMAAIRGEPVHQALQPSRDAADLLARWCRLECYVHSRHRIGYQLKGDVLEVHHRSLRPGEAPLPHESLVVLGVIAAALGEAGLHCTDARVAGVAVLPVTDEAGLAECVRQGQADRWTLTVAGRAGSAQRTAPSIPAGAPGWPGAATALAQWIAHDLAAAPPLAQAARSMGQAPRSLQRELTQHGLSYSAVLARVRCDHAAWHLVNSSCAVAEIGFICGFADQAHFTRTFRRETALTPAAYRREFLTRGASPA